MTPVDVRTQLTDALRLDLVGPGEVLGAEGEALGDAYEVLPQRPSTWYLTGFLVPLDADPEQRTDAQSSDEIDAGSDVHGLEDAVAPEPAAARVRYLPSSLGASLLVPVEATTLRILVRWGDYSARAAADDEPGPVVWVRTPREAEVVVALPLQTAQPLEYNVPTAGGLVVAVSVRPVQAQSTANGLPAGTRSVSVFLVNRRPPKPDDLRDTAFAFQAQLEIRSDRPFIPRPDLHSLDSLDWDERVADLHYRDTCECAVGHNIATEALLNDAGECWIVRTCWLPHAEVERVAPAPIPGVELSMDALGQ
ncbi:MAG: helicase, partial [Candidatus Tectomicrobia bacterium]|nr:helicase [Candidatus Tectomicrobia bacterium]